MISRVSYFCGLIALGVLGLAMLFVVPSSSLFSAFYDDAVFHEHFDGKDPSLMLGGQIEFNPNSTNWKVWVAGEQLTFSNKGDRNASYFDKIKWVRFDGMDTVSRAAGMRLALTVTSRNTGTGGGGMMIGSGRPDFYWYFLVGRNGTYHLLRRKRRGLEVAFSGEHPAIRKEAANRISYKLQGDEILFFANGREVTRVQVDPVAGGQHTLALAAFGKGRFLFDDVEITGKKIPDFLSRPQITQTSTARMRADRL